MGDNSSEIDKYNYSLLQWFGAIILVSIIAAAAGWFFGAHIDNGNVASPYNEVKKSHDKQASKTEHLTLLPEIVKLPSLLVNLANPSSKRVRLDVSLVLKEGEKLSPDLSADITSDFLLFLRTATLDQLKGATGIFYLRQDLLDRARIRSNGKVTAILITSLVLE